MACFTLAWRWDGERQGWTPMQQSSSQVRLWEGAGKLEWLLGLKGSPSALRKGSAPSQIKDKIRDHLSMRTGITALPVSALSNSSRNSPWPSWCRQHLKLDILQHGQHQTTREYHRSRGYGHTALCMELHPKHPLDRGKPPQ